MAPPVLLDLPGKSWVGELATEVALPRERKKMVNRVTAAAAAAAAAAAGGAAGSAGADSGRIFFFTARWCASIRGSHHWRHCTCLCLGCGGKGGATMQRIPSTPYRQA